MKPQTLVRYLSRLVIAGYLGMFVAGAWALLTTFGAAAAARNVLGVALMALVGAVLLAFPVLMLGERSRMVLSASAVAGALFPFARVAPLNPHGIGTVTYVTVAGLAAMAAAWLQARRRTNPAGREPEADLIMGDPRHTC